MDAAAAAPSASLSAADSGAGPQSASSEVKETRTISQLENAVAFTVFVCLGTAAMSYWNALIQSLFSVEIVLFPDNKEASDTITATYTTTALIGTAGILALKDVLPLRCLHLGSAGFAAAAIATPLLNQFAAPKPAIVLYHVIGGLTGFATAIFESSMWGFASILPRNYVGAASFGLGLAGLWCFGAWMLFSKALFSSDPSGVRRACWLLWSIVLALMVAASCGFEWLKSRSWVEKSPTGRSSTPAFSCDSEKGKLDNPPPSSRRRWAIFRDGWEPIANVSITLFLTMTAFPNIAPYHWRRSLTETDVLMGVANISDFLGRYLPNLRRWAPWLSVERHNVKWFTIGRVAFLIIMIAIDHAKTNRVLNSMAFQTVLLVLFQLSNGWICSLSSMQVPTSVDDPAEKRQLASMYLLALLGGITAGIWLTKAWKAV